MFTTHYIAANPHIFLDFLWISVPELRSFVAARDRGSPPMVVPSSAPAVPSHVKRELDASDVSLIDLTVKLEPVSCPLPFHMRSLMESGQEVIELLCDSDEDEPPDEFGI
jgi:hypothetical protein